MPTHAADLPFEWPRGGSHVLRVTTEGAHGLLAKALLPAELLYGAAMAVRNRGYDAGLLPVHRVSMPVISVGNIVAGGAGKTPVTRWLAQQLLARGRRPAILHGGYGDDEPRLHRQWQPDVVVVSERDRVAGARRAIEQGADVIVLDDAFQHRRLARDLDIVLVSADEAAAHMLPRGPGREPMRALRRSSFVMVTRKRAAPDAAMLLETRIHQGAPGIPTARAHLALTAALPADPVVVVAAIARPDLLHAQLVQAGAQVHAFLAYPDHFEYTAEDARHIGARAGRHLVVTTEKDAIKLRALLPEQGLIVVGQQLDFESGEGELMRALDGVL